MHLTLSASKRIEARDGLLGGAAVKVISGSPPKLNIDLTKILFYNYKDINIKTIYDYKMIFL